MAGNNSYLVTGSGGFIGARLTDWLRQRGDEVIAWTRTNGDLRDRDAVASLVSRVRPDYIFHLASEPPGSATEQWHRIAGEQQMLANLAYSMPGHCQLIYTGSMAEYGKSGVLHEADQCVPDTGYGCAKFSGTTLAVALRSILDIDVRVARLFGVYGPGEAPTRLLPSLVAKLGRGEPVPLSDGLQVRDFVHVDDVCAAIAALSAAPSARAPAIVNIGTGVGLSVRQLCERVAEILGADPTLLDFGALPRRSVDQDCLIAGTDALRSFMQPPAQRWLDKRMAADIIASLLAA